MFVVCRFPIGVLATDQVRYIVAPGSRSVFSKKLSFACVFTLLLCCAGSVKNASAQTSVTTWHNDISRTGQNLNETVLTPQNVNSTQFGKLFSQPVDGEIYAQPLYLPGLTINGSKHNVVFVATENDSVYAFDADSNGGSASAPLWQASMVASAHGASSGETAVPSSALENTTDIHPSIGISGTPVIDPTTNTLYVVSKTTLTTSSEFVQRLHALDVTTGAEKFGGPMVLSASVYGSGAGSSGGTLTFDPKWQHQRAGLLLLNGIVYIAFAAHQDFETWHGWVLAYDAATLKQTGVFCTTPNGQEAGIWMAGEGLAAEVVDSVKKPYGRMFVTTGNGDYDATTPYTTNNVDYGDSLLNLDLTNGAPTVQDEFTPSNQGTLYGNDLDLASGGVLLLPTQTTGSYPHLLVQVGKTGTIYLVNRDNLGGYNTSSDQVVQSLPNAITGMWGTPAYWNGTIYMGGAFDGGSSDHLKAFALSKGMLTSSPTAQSSESYGFPGASPSISANGTTNGILWTINSSAFSRTGTPGPGILQAHDASNIATTLYSSDTNPSRDTPGGAVKFTTPIVTNGKVYVGASGQLSVYGLLSSQQTAAAPVFSPGTETFSGSLSATITDATPGATIYYTTDGSTPTTTSTVYSGPVTVNTTTTLQAIASVTNYLQSAVSSATYSNSNQKVIVQINAGGAAAGSYLADEDFSGGMAWTMPSPVTINTSQVTNPAPQAVYQSERAGASTYTIPNLTAGASYTVNLHFAEIYYNAIGQRQFNVLINGTQVLTNFDIIAATGAEYVAIVKSFPATAAANGTITIQFATGAVDLPKVDGIEILQSTTTPSTTALQIDAGSATAAGSYLADQNFSGGSVYSTTATINTSKVGNPAPQAVYQTERYGAFTYTIPNLTAGASYTVNLHLAEIYWNAVGKRIFNVLINGTQVLTNFDIFAAAGGEDIAIVKSFPATAAANGTITIQFTNGATDQPKISGVEILQGTTASTGTIVNLSGKYNIYGIATVGTAPASGGFDNQGYAYNSSLLGTSLNYQNLTFPLAAANTADAVSSIAVPLLAGQYSQLFLLGAGSSGNQMNQTIVATYTDGSSSTFTQNFSDWVTPQNFAGEATVSTTSSRITPSGQSGNPTVYVYGYTFNLTAGKTVASVKLPPNRNVGFFAIGLK